MPDGNERLLLGLIMDVKHMEGGCRKPIHAVFKSSMLSSRRAKNTHFANARRPPRAMRHQPVLFAVTIMLLRVGHQEISRMETMVPKEHVNNKCIRTRRRKSGLLSTGPPPRSL